MRGMKRRHARGARGCDGKDKPGERPIAVILLIAVAVLAGFVAQPPTAGEQIALQPSLPDAVSVDTLRYQWSRQSFGSIPLVRPTVLLVTSWGEVWVTDTGERAVFR